MDLTILDWDRVQMLNAAIGRKKLGIVNGLPDAPSDGNTYGRKNANWVTISGGGGPTGNLTETGSNILTITGGTNAVNGSGTTIDVKQASASQSGYLSSGDWTAFNGKQSALSLGNLTETTSNILTLTGGTGAVVGSGTTIAVKQSSGSQSGYLSSTDWTTFNGKLSDAPSDGSTYGRKNAAWVAITGGGGVPEAPTDGGYYVREDSAWFQLYPPAPNTPMAAWWKMNEGSGTTTADASGNSLTGTLSGTSIPTWVSGPSGGSDNALQFNGASSYVTTGNTNWSSNTISIACWMMRASWSTAKYIPILAMNYGSTSGIGFYLSGSAAQDWLNNALLIVGNGYSVSQIQRGNSIAIVPPAANTWHHVGVVFGPNNCEFYFDGVLLPSHISQPGNITAISTQPIHFGGNPGTSDWSDAAHDDLRVWTRALSAREMYSLFLTGSV